VSTAGKIGVLLAVYLVVGGLVTLVSGGSDLAGLLGGLFGVLLFVVLGPPAARAYVRRQTQRRIDETPVYPDEREDEL
jgi:membrane associated rhomboid family serine protease